LLDKTSKRIPAARAANITIKYDVVGRKNWKKMLWPSRSVNSTRSVSSPESIHPMEKPTKKPDIAAGITDFT
jgi:hypothetical protein